MVASRRKILVVDDEPIAREIITAMLDPEYDVQTAENGKDALMKVLDFQPEVVILDARMPEVDGWEVCRRIKAGSLTSRIKVIMTSAYSTADQDRLAGYRAGADIYLPKPAIQSDLLKRLLDIKTAGI